MRPKTSFRQPVLAGVSGRRLSEMLRTWHGQPRQRSRRLFWGLVALALLLDSCFLVLVGYCLSCPAASESAPPSERRMHVPHARNRELWEPLRRWVIRANGRSLLFETFCRETVRVVTGTEHFEGNDPLAVVVSWLLLDTQSAISWDDYPFLRCDSMELRDRLASGPYIEPSVLRSSASFRLILRGIAAKGGAAEGVSLSALERAALALKNRLTLYDQIRAGDGIGAGKELETPQAALREAYLSGSVDLFAAALSDFVEATRGEGSGEGEGADSRRLACEHWLNEKDPFRRALAPGALAAGLLALAALTRGKPALYRILLACGWLAGFTCLTWTAAGLIGQTIVYQGTPVNDGRDGLRWAASVVLVVGLLFTLIRRDVGGALIGVLMVCAGLALAEYWPPAFVASWPDLPKLPEGDFCMSVQVATMFSAYAMLALAWGIALMTLGRLLLAPPNVEYPRGIASLCVRSVGLGLLLLIGSAALDGLRALQLGDGWRGGSAQAMGTLLVLPYCAALLHARRLGWIGPFGLLIGVAIGFTLLAVGWQAARVLSVWEEHYSASLATDAPVWGTALASLSLAVHAALRYYFGKQRVWEV